MSNSLLKVVFSVALILLGAVGVGINYVNGNMPAVTGYFSATCGWLIVAGFNIVSYLEERKYRVNV